MNIIILPLILAAFGFWLFAEFKLGRGARIILGLVSIVCGGFLVYAVCQIRPFYESAWHRNSIRDATALLKEGQTNVVISVFETYSSIATTGSTFRASEQLTHTLSQKVEPNTKIDCKMSYDGKAGRF
ncbi:MAG TPA: hypothetical protein VKA67_10110 [Verrucomicrobiae bacterium]|nr:hypothetical protein [Verrucomicrobiae bacterium]